MLLSDTNTQRVYAPASLPWRRNLFYVLLFLGAVALWAVPLKRPLDLPSWHEFDDAAMARNFIQQPSSILYPRIDWRGNGPGFAESEFPLYPWLLSQSYGVFGVNILYGRILSLLAMLGSLVFFTLLARSMLPEMGAIVAVLFFSTNRIVNFVATALQPEAFMFLFYVMAVYGFLRWRAQKSWFMYLLTILSWSAAMLEKSPAAHLGIFFFLVLLWEEGWKCIRSGANWCLGLFSLVAPVLWYTHAHKLWIVYGNSLGISNENHWFDWDILYRLNRPVGLIAIEFLFVFSVGGVLLAALSAFQWRSRTVKIVLLWFGSIAFYYVVTIRTTGALWAWYYHIVSVAPMALLSGAAMAAIQNSRFRMKTVIAGALASAISIWILLAALFRLSRAGGVGFVSDLTLTNYSISQKVGAALLCVAVTALLFWLWRAPSVAISHAPPWRAAAFFCAAGVAAYLLVSVDLIANDIRSYSQPTEEMRCANTFRSMVPEHALILASGGACADYSGHMAAFNAPNMFYWLDRKGFSICEGRQSIAQVHHFASLGAQVFVADKVSVHTVPGFESDLKKTFPLLSECSAGWLFDLRKPEAK